MIYRLICTAEGQANIILILLPHEIFPWNYQKKISIAIRNLNANKPENPFIQQYIPLLPSEYPEVLTIF